MSRTFVTCAGATTIFMAAVLSSPAQAMTIAAPAALGKAIQQTTLTQDVSCRCWRGAYYRPRAYYSYAYYRPYYSYAYYRPYYYRPYYYSYAYYRPYYTYSYYYRPYYSYVYVYRPYYSYAYYRPAYYAYAAAPVAYRPVWFGWHRRGWW